MRDGEALFYQAPGGSPIVWTTFRSGLTFAPAHVQSLAARGLWLEQERIVLDPRLPGALEALLR